MKKLIIVLLAALPILHTGCYTRLNLVRSRTIEAENYVVVEETTDDVACTYNDDYAHSYSIWDWELSYDPFRPSWYIYPYIGCFSIWPWPYNTWYSTYWGVWRYSQGPRPHENWYRDAQYFTWKSEKKRNFNRRQAFHTGRTGSNSGQTDNILSFFDKRTLLTGSSRNVSISKNQALRLKKSNNRRKPGIFDTVKETYHRISKYNSGSRSVIGSLTKAASNIRRASGGSSKSKSSSGSGIRQRTRK